MFSPVALVGFYGILLLPVLAKSNTGPQVNLGYATYEGMRLGNGVNQFLGIRYAAPPIGQRRLRRPFPPLNEPGIVQAKEHGPICYGVEGLAFPPPPVPVAEDCLFIDVYTPITPSSQTPRNGQGLPAMLWFQGGAFVQLFNSNYNGTGIVKANQDGVIVVTFNYRVGPYGFLASKELEQEGNLNLGLHDQRAAMAWVQKHIAKFGGDPRKVTLFGTSIGGGSVLLQTLAYRGNPPRNDGVDWRSGIAQAINIPPILPVKDLQYQYDQFLNAANCTTTSNSLSCLRSLTSEQFQSANIGRPQLPNQSTSPLFPYSPAIDGPTGLFTSSPLSMLQSGHFSKSRPLIIGTSHTEGTLFIPQTTITTPSDINTFLLTQFPNLSPQDLASANLLYSSIAPDKALFPTLNITAPISPLYYRLATMYGDLGFSCPALEFANALSNANVPVRLFRTNILDPVEVGAGYVVPHTWEVQAVWGGPEYATNYAALPGAEASYTIRGVNRDVVGEVMRYWGGFVRSGGVAGVLGGRVSWERYYYGGSRGRGDDGRGVRGGLRLKLETNATVMERVAEIEYERCTLWRSVSERTGI